jgi:hypothetical protein
VVVELVKYQKLSPFLSSIPNGHVFESAWDSSNVNQMLLKMCFIGLHFGVVVVRLVSSNCLNQMPTKNVLYWLALGCGYGDEFAFQGSSNDSN